MSLSEKHVSSRSDKSRGSDEYNESYQLMTHHYTMIPEWRFMRTQKILNNSSLFSQILYSSIGSPCQINTNGSNARIAIERCARINWSDINQVIFVKNIMLEVPNVHSHYVSTIQQRQICEDISINIINSSQLSLYTIYSK